MIDEDKIEKAAKEYFEKNKTLIKNTTSISLTLLPLSQGSKL